MGNKFRLLELAKEAREKAYSPYSQFRVGASLFSKSGNFYSGCNVENSSYGLTVCAERNAIAQMVLCGDLLIKEILIISDSDNIISPCGACRQVILEFADQNTKIYMCNKEGICKESLFYKLLPESFSLK